MPASAADWFDVALRALGAVAGGLVTLAAAIYGVQRRLKRDKRDDTDATLLGRGKQTIFEQYDGIIVRLQDEVGRYREEVARIRSDMQIMRETMTQANRRILELELENKVKRETIADLVAQMRRIKHGQMAPEDINTGIWTGH